MLSRFTCCFRPVDSSCGSSDTAPAEQHLPQCRSTCSAEEQDLSHEPIISGQAGAETVLDNSTGATGTDNKALGLQSIPASLDACPADSQQQQQLQQQQQVPNETESTPSSASADALETRLKVDFKELTFHELIGKGSFKTVYRGRWNNTNVAIISMRRGGMVTDARVLQRLSNHPNLIQFYRWTVDDKGNEYMVTELAQLGSLDKLLISFGNALRTRAKLTMCEQICSAMTELVAEKVLHRDLAARNVLVQSIDPMHIKVADFGLARVGPSTSTSPSNISVPVRWCPPEVLTRAEWSEKSDVYSFGVVVWEIFSNCAEPYASRSDREVCEAVLAGKVLPRPSKCPKEVYQLMLACWRHNALERPTFEQVAQRFRAWRESYLAARVESAAGRSSFDMGGDHKSPPSSSTLQPGPSGVAEDDLEATPAGLSSARLPRLSSRAAENQQPEGQHQETVDVVYSSALSRCSAPVHSHSETHLLDALANEVKSSISADTSSHAASSFDPLATPNSKSSRNSGATPHSGEDEQHASNRAMDSIAEGSVLLSFDMELPIDPTISCSTLQSIHARSPLNTLTVQAAMTALGNAATATDKCGESGNMRISRLNPSFKPLARTPSSPQLSADRAAGESVSRSCSQTEKSQQLKVERRQPLVLGARSVGDYQSDDASTVPGKQTQQAAGAAGSSSREPGDADLPAKPSQSTGYVTIASLTKTAAPPPPRQGAGSNPYVTIGSLLEKW